MRRFTLSPVLFAVLLLVALISTLVRNAQDTKSAQTVNFPLFTYLTGKPVPRMVAYSPSQLDPRSPLNHKLLSTSSIQADLKSLRPVFDGLVLYGYNKDSTPRIMEVAKRLKFRAVLLGIWNPKSTEEVDGVAALANKYHKDIALGIVVGNEGFTFGRYGPGDLNTAADRLLPKIPQTIAITTSEPLTMSLESGFIQYFGDFMAPNIHPVWDRPTLSAQEAATWSREQAVKLALKAEKPIFVKETGFPNAGKEGYTPETQKAFWASYVKAGVIAHPPKHNDIWIFHGVAFEAFDLPWKTIATNIPIEKSWGLFSTDRKGYPALSVWQTLTK